MHNNFLQKISVVLNSYEESMNVCFIEIAKKIKNLRKEHGLTQKQMAERLQMDTH